MRNSAGGYGVFAKDNVDCECEEMKYILIAAAVIAVIITLKIAGDRKYKRNRIISAERSFGAERKMNSDLEDRMKQVRILYDIEKDLVPKEKLVDEITWNDLNMDDIFAMVNHTDSFAGEQNMYSKLHILCGNEKYFEKQEKLIAQFESDRELRNKVKITLSSLGKMTSSYHIPELVNKLDEQKRTFRFIPYILLGVFLASIVATIVLHSLNSLMIVLFFFILNLISNSVLKMKHTFRMHTLFILACLIGTASELSGLMKEKNERITEIVRKMKKISGLMSLFSLSNRRSDDPFLAIFDFIFGAFMIDYIIYDVILMEMIKYREEYMELYDFVGDIDCAIAVLSFRNSLDKYCIPKITKERSFELKECVHPAVNNAVPNDFSYSSNVILTGSNASGKSTFIKMAAINLILGQTINTCTAEYAVIPECSVMTSMAVRDDVITGESYYIKEIKYLKRMTESVNEKRLMFFAIDEILKGTNTRERISASKAVLKYFSDKNCILIVATHDTELANAFDNSFENYYFTENVSDGDISFDYKLHKGISKTTNAIRLLEIIGFPEEIIKTASAQ